MEIYDCRDNNNNKDDDDDDGNRVKKNLHRVKERDKLKYGNMLHVNQEMKSKIKEKKNDKRQVWFISVF